MAVEKSFFRQVLGKFATGVTVVTTCSQGIPAGITVNAFCSVSLHPPLVLVCIDHSSNTLPLLRESKAFAVNMLTAQQESLSRCFSSYSDERTEDFCHAHYHTVATGAPILDGSLAFVDARIVAEYPGGDHAIFLGQVEALGAHGKIALANGTEENLIDDPLAAQNGMLASDEAHPLLYYEGQYRHLSAQYHKPSMEIQPEYNGKLEKQTR